MKIVIDTNVLLSALIRDSVSRQLIVSLNDSFYYPEAAFDEITRNKALVLEKGKISSEEFNRVLLTLFKYVALVKQGELAPYLQEADEIIGKIHKNDVVFIAAALAKNAAVWSNDGHFQKQNKVRVITTREIMRN